MIWFSSFLMTLLMLSGLFLIGLILLQRGRGGGLAGAFGGMGGQSAFGTKAGDVFTRITIGVATAWILLCAGSVIALQNTKGDKLKKIAAPEAKADATKKIQINGDGFDDDDLKLDANNKKNEPAVPQVKEPEQKKDDAVKTDDQGAAAAPKQPVEAGKEDPKSDAANDNPPKADERKPADPTPPATTDEKPKP